MWISLTTRAPIGAAAHAFRLSRSTSQLGSKTPRRRSAAPRRSAPKRLCTCLHLSRQGAAQRYRMKTDATRPFATHAMPVIRRWLYAGEKLVAFELAWESEFDVDERERRIRAL